MKYRKPAEITVFLTLIFSILSLLILACIKSARTWESKQQIEIVTDISINSAFSEYNKTLFDNYGLLYVDTTYKGTSEGGLAIFKNHVSQYADANSMPGLTLIEVDIQNEVFASENDSVYEMISNLNMTVDDYIFSVFSYRNNKKPLSENEYEIEYIAGGKYEELQNTNTDQYSESDGFTDGEIISDVEYEILLKDMLSGVNENEKIERIKDAITGNMKANYDEKFDFSMHLEKCDVTLFFEDENGNITSCQR